MFVAPALSIWPSLIAKTKTAFSIPILSVLIIGVIQYFLSQFGYFNYSVVMSLSCLFVVVAVIRVYSLRLVLQGNWNQYAFYAYLFGLLIWIIFAADLGTTAFDTNDEIYSWNMWAIQHYQGQPIDLNYTAAYYPQLFSVIIAYSYALLGGIEYHLPIRVMLGMLPGILFLAIVFAGHSLSAARLVGASLLFLVMVLAQGLKGVLNEGLADPLMATAFVLSVYFFIQCYRTYDIRLLVLSTICALVAAYTKQPGLLWAGLLLPLFISYYIFKGRFEKSAWVLGAISFLVTAFWLVFIAPEFHQNQGVILPSQGNREILEQLLYGFERFFIKKPLVLLLLILTFLIAFKHRQQGIYLLLVFFVVVPYILLWVLFGAYNYRLGLHVIMLMMLIVCSESLFSSIFIQRISDFFERKTLKLIRIEWFVMLFVLLTVSIAMISANKNMSKYYHGLFNPNHGAETAIAKYYGADAPKLFMDILHNPEEKQLWFASNYTYGLFYGYQPTFRPIYTQELPYTRTTLLTEIEQYKIKYLFDTSPKYAFGPASEILKQMVEHDCAYLFEIVASPINDKGYVVYLVRQDAELFQRCKQSL